MDGKISKLDEKIDSRYDALDQKIDRCYDALDQKIDRCYAELDQKIDRCYKELDDKIDSYCNALDYEINKVYLIACDNQENIKNLLLPFNDRNHYANEEIAKIPDLAKRIDQVEEVVGDHSEAIRNLQEQIA